MVTLEFGTDGFHAHTGDLADDIHRHLAGGTHIGAALFPADVGGYHIIGARHFVDDLFNRNGDGLGIIQCILDGGRRHADAGGNTLQHIVGVKLFHCALQLADVLLQMVGDIFRNVIRQIQIQQFGLALDDRHTGFEIRRLDIRRQAPLEPGAQTLFQALDLLGRPVGCQHDLLAGIMQRIKSMEKLFLR